MLLITHQYFGCCCVVLSQIKDFSVSLSSAREEMDKKLGGTMVQSGHKDIPYHRMPCSAYRLGGVGCKGLTTAQGQPGHCSVGVDKLHCACFSEFIFIITIIISSSSS